MDATEGSASTAQPVDEAEEEQIEDDNYDFDNSTTDESTPPAESGGVDIEPIGQEDEAEESSAPYYYGCSVMGFDFWTFFGGFFLGIGSSVIIQAFYSFYKMKKKSYNVPYQFDSFVNQ